MLIEQGSRVPPVVSGDERRGEFECQLVLESSSHLTDYLRILDDEAVFEAIFHNITNIKKLRIKRRKTKISPPFLRNDVFTLNKFPQSY